MKILHLVHNFPPAFTGGTELYVQHVAAAQQAAGHEVLVVTGTTERDWECRPTEERVGRLRVVRLRRCPRPLVLVTENYDPLLLRRLEEILTREKPDVVHAHHWLNLSTGILALAAERRIPAAVTFHDLFVVCARFFRYRPDGSCTPPRDLMPCPRCGDEDYPFPAWERAADYRLRAADLARDLQAAALLLFPSRAHRDYLLPVLPVPPERARVLPHGLLPLPPVEPPPPPEAFGPERPLRVGYWGNLVRAKGIPDLVAAAARLRERGRAVEIHLWGRVLEPDLEGELREAPGVFLHGPFGREAFPQLRAQLDLAAFPSLLQESYGFTVDEAAALRLPVVVSDRGALAERLDGRGWVVPAGDREALAAVLEEVYRDPPGLAARGRSLPQPPPVAATARELLGLYEGMRAAGAPPPPPPLDPRPRLEHWYRRLCARENWLQDLVRQRKEP